MGYIYKALPRNWDCWEEIIFRFILAKQETKKEIKESYSTANNSFNSMHIKVLHLHYKHTKLGIFVNYMNLYNTYHP